MNFIESQSRTISLTANDSDFYLTDGMVVIPRAMACIDKNCPAEYKMIIATCIMNKWLTLSAAIYNHEQTFLTLKS